MVECEKITFESHVDNGGTLKRYNLVRNIDTEYIVCAKNKNGKVIGFAVLRTDFCGLNDLCIRQIAVSTKNARKGIGAKIVFFLFKCAKNKFDYISADVSVDNDVSRNFFENKLGFVNVPAHLSYSRRYVFDLRRLEVEENVIKSSKK